MCYTAMKVNLIKDENGKLVHPLQPAIRRARKTGHYDVWVALDRAKRGAGGTCRYQVYFPELDAVGTNLVANWSNIDRSTQAYLKFAGIAMWIMDEIEAKRYHTQCELSDVPVSQWKSRGF